MSQKFDFIIIGAGIAGASIAARLAQFTSRIAVLEREDQPGYHSTGRSAATFVENYGSPAFMGLARASGDFFRTAHETGFCDTQLLSPRGELMIAREGDEEHVREAKGLGLKEIALDQVKEIISPLKQENFVTALVDNSAEDIDVDVLHQGFLKLVRTAGGTVNCKSEVTGITNANGSWQIDTPTGSFSAPVVINAAGAWCDVMAEMAGVRPIGLKPCRRSAALIDVPTEWNVDSWPLTFGAGETFYFKPMGGKLMLSPADATPVEPHDAWADDMKIAEAVEMFQEAVDFEVTRLDHTWGGLRSFAPDKDPVSGFAPDAEGFYWLAGQGGYGIQTSPALSDLSAHLALGKPVPPYILDQGVSEAAVSPARFS